MKLFKAENEFFNAELPDVLIQDSKNAISYFIPADQLSKFETKSIEHEEDLLTFLIPNGDLIDDVNEFSSHSENSSVLIKHPAGEANYLITQNNLKKFELRTFEEMTKIVDNCVSFIIPAGDELLEDIPNLAPSMLQSNTPVTEFPAPIKRHA